MMPKDGPAQAGLIYGIRLMGAKKQVGQMQHGWLNRSQERSVAFVPSVLICGIWAYKGLSCQAWHYFILSTQVNKRLHLMPLNPARSTSCDHQMNMGLPTTWSSGTKPQ